MVRLEEVEIEELGKSDPLLGVTRFPVNYVSQCRRVSLSSYSVDG